jgi:PAS domain S-box-containing protein
MANANPPIVREVPGDGPAHPGQDGAGRPENTQIARWWRGSAGYCVAILGVAVVTAIFAPFQPTLSTTTVALAYLLVVLFTATGWGSRPAMLVSVLSVLCYNFFFLPPILSLTIDDPQNWIALAAFLVTALTAGNLSERAKRRAAAAGAARAVSAYNRSLIEADLDPLMTVDADGRIIDANSAAEAVTGRSRAELIGTDFSHCFTEQNLALEAYQQAWRADVVRDRALEVRHRDGHSTSVLLNASVYRDDRGDAIGVVVAARPISTSAGRPTRALADPDVVSFLGHFVAFASALSVAVGLLGLAGWVFGVPVLKSVIPGEVVIKPNAAVGLVLLGRALWLMRKPGDRPAAGARKRAGRLLAAFVAAFGVLSLVEQVTGWDLGIDQLLFREPPADAIGSLRPGLVAPITALDFLLLGLALLGLDRTIPWRSRRYSFAPMLACVAGITSIVGLLDFVLKSAVSYTHIALQTAVTLCLLAAGAVCARTERGIAALLVSTSLGGTLVRRLLPAAIVIPILIGALWWTALSAGASSLWAGEAMMIVAMIVLMGSLTVLIGSLIDRADIERRDAEQALHRREEELREAQRLARVGSWYWDIRTHNLVWSEELHRIVGRDPKSPLPAYEEHGRFYAAESFARLNTAVEQALRTGTPFELDVEMVTEAGIRRSVTARGEAERDDAGDVVWLRGTMHDITERKLTEEALRRSADEIHDLYNHAPCGYHSLDPAGVYIRINDTELEWLGYAREDVIGKLKFLDVLAPRSVGTFEAEFSRLKAAGSMRDVEYEMIRKDGGILPVLVSATAITDAGGNYLMSRSMVYDMTQRRRVEERLRRVNRAHRALSTSNQVLVRATDELTLVQQICRIIVNEAGYRLCWVGYAEQDAARTVRPIAQAGFEEGYLRTANISWADTERGRGPTGTCIRVGQIQIAKNIATDPRMAPWRVDASRRGYASSIAIPLGDAARTFGALTIYSSEKEAFGGEEVRLLTELAGDLSYGITSLRSRAERERAAAEEIAREREVAIGFRIQQMLLLDEPPRDIPGLRVAALTVPSQRIAGDFYGFFAHQDTSLDIIVADVMGKGVPAALLGAAAKSHFTQALCHLMALPPAGVLPEPREVVTLAHAGMGRHLIELESFVTLCYARVDLIRRRLELVDCGHTGVIHVRGASGLCDMIHGDNLPLGIREGEIYDQIAIPFETGDVFVFFSDGITEAPDAARERFGTDRLLACVRENGGLPPDALVNAIRAAVVAFAGSDQLADDLTCVAVEIGEDRRPLARAELEIGSHLTELGRAREFVRGFCHSLPGSPLNEDHVAELELAVTEAASNIMKHAYHGRADQWIQMEAEAFPDHVAVRLHHLGNSFDPSVVALPVFDGSRESGFGVYLLRRSVDDVRYYRDQRGGNCIALVKMHKS